MTIGSYTLNIHELMTKRWKINYLIVGMVFCLVVPSHSVGNCVSFTMSGHRFLYIQYQRSYDKKMKDYTLFKLDRRTLTEVRELRYADVRLVTLRRIRSL